MSVRVLLSLRFLGQLDRSHALTYTRTALSSASSLGTSTPLTLTHIHTYTHACFEQRIESWENYTSLFDRIFSDDDDDNDLGAHFTCFTGTRVRILTRQKALVKKALVKVLPLTPSSGALFDVLSLLVLLLQKYKY